MNITLSKMVGEPAIDIFDVMSGFVLLIVAAAFIFGDYAKRNGHLR